MRRRNNIQLILLILVIALGIGYAYINSDLNINGTAQVNSANWDVHWANVQVKTGSVSGSNVVTQPTISNSTTVNYSIILSQPGDYYEFTVDAVNGGVIDAMIDTMDFKLNGATMTNQPEYLNYTVTYSDGTELVQNHELLANTTETYKVRVEYRTDIELNQLPATNQTLSLRFAVTYRQATADAIEVEHEKIVYTSNLLGDNGTIYLGQAIPNGITQYSSASEALAALRTATRNNNIQFYLKHKVQGGIVTESYVEFIVTPAMASANPGMTAGTYALRGLDIYDNTTHDCTKEEYYNSNLDICISPFFESNYETTLQAFGSEICSNGNYHYPYDFYCGVPGLYVGYSYGNVYAGLGGSNWDCSVVDNGHSDCDARD